MRPNLTGSDLLVSELLVSIFRHDPERSCVGHFPMFGAQNVVVGFVCLSLSKLGFLGSQFGVLV